MSGLPIWALCAIVFAAILGLALVVVLYPGQAAERRSAQARLDEVFRYRVLGAYESSDADTSVDAQQQSALTGRALAAIDRLVKARGLHRRLLGELERSGLTMRVEEWAAIQIGSVVATAVIGLALVGVLGALAGAALGWLGCRALLSVKTSRRIAAFERQLPSALQLLAGALRTGFSFTQAVGTVIREGSEPLAGEFGRALHEARLGADLETALDDLAGRMRSDDLALVVMAVRTSREVGGNLAEVLQTTVATMRERSQMRAEVRVLSAEGRFSAKVLVALPFLMGAYLLTFKRAYLVPLYTTGLGVALLVVGGVLLLTGTFWLSRLTKIEV